ncbi:MAG: holdfast anchoring protein HfaA [Pirellulales bacterium]|nr:holdfast anchoring protein HfaA [Pirellulales bacterium]
MSRIGWHVRCCLSPIFGEDGSDPMTASESVVSIRARPLFGAAALATIALAVAPGFAHAQAVVSSEFNRPYGMNFGDESRPFDPGTRDANGNRVIIDGRIVTESDASFVTRSDFGGVGGGGFGLGGATAIGNQLNVVTQGSWNTVIVDSTQINEGDQTAQVTIGDEGGVDGED